MRSATSSASRCSRTKPCIKDTWPPRTPPGGKSFFDARQIPSVAYTDPEIAWTGLTEQDAKARNVAFKKAVFPWVASGRALANGRAEGLTKLLFDPETHRLLGGAIVGTHAGDLIAEICLGVGTRSRRHRHRQDDPSPSDAIGNDWHVR